MAKGYYVYSGVDHYYDPVASFTTLENANKLSELLSSHTEPIEIEGDFPEDINKYLLHLEAGLIPSDVALNDDGTVFEIDNGFEGVLLSDPTYYPDNGGAFSGTFWANSIDEAIEIARRQLFELKAKL